MESIDLYYPSASGLFNFVIYRSTSCQRRHAPLAYVKHADSESCSLDGLKAFVAGRTTGVASAGQWFKDVIPYFAERLFLS